MGCQCIWKFTLPHGRALQAGPDPTRPPLTSITPFRQRVSHLPLTQSHHSTLKNNSSKWVLLAGSILIRVRRPLLQKFPSVSVRAASHRDHSKIMLGNNVRRKDQCHENAYIIHHPVLSIVSSCEVDANHNSEARAATWPR